MAQRGKTRRACRQQMLTQAPRPFVSASANCRGDNHRPKTMPAKLIRISDSPSNIRQSSNVARTIVRTRDVRTTGGGVSSPESPCVSYHPQAIRTYLNQTVPLLAQQHPRTRSRTFCRGNPPVDRSFVTADAAATINNRVKSATRDQGGRLHARHGLDVGQRRSSATCDKSRFLNSHSQSHGVIAESVYRDLCNGTIRWWDARRAGFAGMRNDDQAGESWRDAQADRSFPRELLRATSLRNLQSRCS